MEESTKVDGFDKPRVVDNRGRNAVKCKFNSRFEEKEWEPPPVFLTEEFHGQRILMATVQGIAKSRTWLSDLHFADHAALSHTSMAHADNLIYQTASFH